jgi:hypothetical protein
MKRYLILMLLVGLPALGEELPNAPNPASTYIAQPSSQFVGTSSGVRDASVHHFLDGGNKLRMAIFAGLVAADGISTQEILNSGGHWREMNPLARPFVNHGAPGQLAASAIGFGFSVGSSYLLHKTGHHKLEKLMLNASIGVEAEVVSSNLIWYSTR